MASIRDVALLDTAASASVPIQVAGASIGAIQVIEPGGTLADEQEEVLTATAARLGQHLNNLRLLAAAESYRAEAEQAVRQLTSRGWEEYLSASKASTRGFVYDQTAVRPLDTSRNGESNGALKQPLLVRNEPIGELEVEAGMRSEEASEIVFAVASQLSSHIENLRLLEQTEAQQAQTNRLYEIGRQISAARDQQEIVAAVAENIGLPQINRAILLSYDFDANGELQDVTVTGNWHSGQGSAPTPLGRHYPANVFTIVNFFNGREPGFVSDTQHDERVDTASAKVFKAQDILSFASLPVWDDTHQIGSLLLEAEETIQFTGEELLPYRSIAQQLGIALQNKNLLVQTQQGEARLRTLVENAPEAIVVVNLETGLFIEPNENATRLYGLSREDLLRVGPAQMSPPTQPDGRDSTEKAQEMIAEAMGGKTPVFEWTHRNAQGQDIPCEVRDRKSVV